MGFQPSRASIFTAPPQTIRKGGTQSYWLKSHVFRDMVALPDERRPWAYDSAHRFKETSSP